MLFCSYSAAKSSSQHVLQTLPEEMQPLGGLSPAHSALPEGLSSEVLKVRSGCVTFGGMSSSCRNQELRSNFSMRGGRGGFSEVGSEFCLGISVR